mmetsp:Transcript_22273/g.56757  ORF Transcript_22273/g.56757 Transcript_22273/m.56757 type:complete len:213 (+) Transcript_22273:726-1364(+)
MMPGMLAAVSARLMGYCPQKKELSTFTVPNTSLVKGPKTPSSKYPTLNPSITAESSGLSAVSVTYCPVQCPQSLAVTWSAASLYWVASEDSPSFSARVAPTVSAAREAKRPQKKSVASWSSQRSQVLSSQCCMSQARSFCTSVSGPPNSSDFTHSMPSKSFASNNPSAYRATASDRRAGPSFCGRHQSPVYGTPLGMVYLGSDRMSIPFGSG